MKRGTSTFVLNIKKNIYPKPKRAQVWVETVIYTLIAFVMIGLVLTFAKPEIEKLQDKILIDQSITVLKEIESTISTMGVAGNQRILEIGIKKGELRINSITDQIIFEMESRYTYSEPSIEILDGNLKIYTDKIGSINIVTLTRDFSDVYDIQYNGGEELETLTKSSATYKLLITNEGQSGSKPIINFNLI